MATIKGQNLRIFIDGSPVALATSCQVQIQTEFAETLTKDDTDGWVSRHPKGHSWTMQVEALCPQQVREQRMIRGFSAFESMYLSEWIRVPAKSVATIELGPASYSGFFGKIYRNSQPILQGATEIIDYTGDEYTFFEWENEGGDCYYIAFEKTNDVSCSLDLYQYGESSPETIMELLDEGQTVEVAFSKTTGDMNRKAQGAVLIGNAKVTELSINAPNRELVTYSATLTGEGELVDASRFQVIKGKFPASFDDLGGTGRVIIAAYDIEPLRKLRITVKGSSGSDASPTDLLAANGEVVSDYMYAGSRLCLYLNSLSRDPYGRYTYEFLANQEFLGRGFNILGIEYVP